MEVYQYTRHIFGAKDSPTCSTLARQNTASDNEERFPVAALAVKSKLYIDDYLDSVDSVERAIQRAKTLTALLKHGGINLTKFVSNIPELGAQINDNSNESEHKSNTASSEESESSHVLRLRWNHVKNTLVVSRGMDACVDETITQQVMLSHVSSVFDPISLIASYTVFARLLLKEIWRLQGQQWKDELPEDISQHFLQ